MAGRRVSPADALKVVIETLDPLEANEKQWVLQSAANLWTVAVTAAGEGSPRATNAAAAPNAAALTKSAQDPKSFVKAKDPQSETQRVACLAYYLANFRDTHAFKAADISKLNTEAKGPTFNVPRAVGNAANAKHRYLSTVGKGQKQITSHGEEIVEALPDIEKVKEVEARKTTKRGRPKKKANKRT